MSNIKISRELINSIANQDKSKFIKDVNKRVNGLVATSIDALSSKISYINVKNCIFQPINELLNNSFIDNSNYEYLLGIDNAQLEINTAKKLNFWESFKSKLKYAWDNRKTFSKRKKRRKKRRKKTEYESQDLNNIKFDPQKYTIYNLAEDLQTSLCNYLSDTSLISLNKNVIKIWGKEDFGFNTVIIIHVMSYSENKYKYYIDKKKGYIDIDIEKRFNAIDKKINQVGKNFSKMLKIFNTLFYNVNGYMPNQVYIESILCDCPNDLFAGSDLYKVFLKIVNYISIKSLRNIKSINDENKTINEDLICGNCGIGFSKMLKIIK